MMLALSSGARNWHLSWKRRSCRVSKSYTQVAILGILRDEAVSKFLVLRYAQVTRCILGRNDRATR